MGNKSKDNQVLLTKDGVLKGFTKSDVLGGVLVIPEGTKRIESLEFYGKTEDESEPTIKEIKIPDGVLTIDDDAITDFEDLEELYMPDSVVELGDNNFVNCKNLVNIRLSRSLTVIPESVYDALMETDCWCIIFPDQAELDVTNQIDVNSNLENGITEMESGICRLVYSGKNNAYNGFCDILDNGGHSISVNIGSNADKSYRFKRIGISKENGSFSLVRQDLKFLKSSGPKITMQTYRNLDKITELTISAKDGKIIGPCALSQCPNLETVIIEDGIEMIQEGAFAECMKLKKVVIPASVRTIGDFAFFDCDSLETVEFKGESLDEIGDWAFNDCSILKRIALPKRVGRIGVGAFADCELLEEVDKLEETEIIDISAFDECKNLIFKMPSGVREIGFCAFQNIGVNIQKYQADMEEELVDMPIVLPKELKTMDESAFFESGITSLEFSKECECLSIPIEAFRFCKYLQRVILPDGLTSIEEEAFDGCEMLRRIEIPASVTIIGDYAFSYCPQLSEVIFYNPTFNVENIGESVFSNSPLVRLLRETANTKIKSVDLLDNENGVIRYYTKNDVEDGVLIIPDGTRIIKSLIFKPETPDEEAPVITEIKILDGVLSIEDDAIVDFENLEKVIMPDSITELGNGNFTNCTNLEIIRISRSISTLRYSTHEAIRNSLVTCLILPYDITIKGVEFLSRFRNNAEADNYAEWHGDRFTYFGKNHPSNIYYHAEEQFMATSVVNVGKNFYYKVQQVCREQGDPEIVSRITKDLPNANSMITINTYDNLDEIEALTISPKDGKFIGPCALAQCPRLETVIIEDGVEEIGPGAFAECPKLKSIIIPKSVKRIGEFAFYGCESLENVEFLGDSVKEISDKAFAECDNLQSVALPKYIGKIGFCAFDYCPKLESVSGWEEVDSIEANAFDYCDRLHLQLPRVVRKIGFCAFQNVGSVIQKEREENGEEPIQMDIVLPKQLRTLDESAFQGSGITGFTMDDKAKIDVIPKRCLSGCHYLKEVQLPEGIKKLEDYAFENCSSIEEIDIPQSTTFIGDFCFSGCSRLVEARLYNLDGKEKLHKPTSFEASTIIKYAAERTIAPRAIQENKGFSFSDILRRINKGTR